MATTNGIQALGSVQTTYAVEPAKEVIKPEGAGRSQGSVTPPTPAGGTAATTGSVDQARLSSTSSLIAQALKGSDVRTEKVAALQQSIFNGTYHVAASDVAGKLIDSLLS